MKKETLSVALAYLTIYIVWGSTYFFIKMSVETIPPALLVGLRFTCGGILILGFCALTRRIRGIPSLRQLGAAVLMGGMLLFGGNNLLSIAEQTVDSYLVALILATCPLIVAFFDRVLFAKKITGLRLAGILLGVGGVGVLLYDGRSLTGSLTPHIFLVLASALLWSLGTSLGHRLPAYPDPLAHSGLQMLSSGLLSLALNHLLGNRLGEVLNSISNRSLLGLAYLAVIGSFAFSAYIYLIHHEPASRIVSYALVNPVIAVLLGLLVGQEHPVPFLFLGLPFILCGLAIMLYGETALALLKKRRLQG